MLEHLCARLGEVDAGAPNDPQRDSVTLREELTRAAA